MFYFALCQGYLSKILINLIDLSRMFGLFVVNYSCCRFLFSLFKNVEMTYK